jgi:hypothetical protein
MMGGPKAGADFGASVTNKRAGAGTIGETAAIARRSASESGESASAPSFAAAIDQSPDPVLNKGSPEAPPQKVEPVAAPEDPAHPDGIQLRRSKAGAGLLKETTTAAENNATHLILAGRAYAYGKNIVRKDDGQKPGEVLAIDS